MLPQQKSKNFFAEIINTLIFAHPNGSIAQLVQSICLTSRGSAVRARVLPQSPAKWRDFAFMEYHIYNLYAAKLDRYYIGSTGDDLQERIRRNNIHY